MKYGVYAERSDAPDLQLTVNDQWGGFMCPSEFKLFDDRDEAQKVADRHQETITTRKVVVRRA